MKNEQEYNRIYKLLKLIAVALVLVISVLVLIIVIIEQPTQDNAALEQETSAQILEVQTTTFTPVPIIEQPATVEPIITEVVTAEPTAVPTLTPMPTAYITPEPLYGQDTMWINVSYLVMRDRAGFENEIIGHIPYGTKVTGEVDEPWMYTSYNGMSGYIYVGNMDGNNRACAVYSESELVPLD